jgi:hypothetical protein
MTLLSTDRLAGPVTNFTERFGRFNVEVKPLRT